MLFTELLRNTRLTRNIKLHAKLWISCFHFATQGSIIKLLLSQSEKELESASGAVPMAMSSWARNVEAKRQTSTHYYTLQYWSYRKWSQYLRPETAAAVLFREAKSLSYLSVKDLCQHFSIGFNNSRSSFSTLVDATADDDATSNSYSYSHGYGHGHGHARKRVW